MTTTANFNRHGFIHIDCQLTASYYRLFIWLAVVIFLVGIIGLLALPLMLRVALWVLLMVSVMLNQLATHQLLMISSLPVKRSKQRAYQDILLPKIDWQIQCIQGYFFTPFGKKTDIYQAKLAKVTSLGMAVWVEFLITEPFHKKMQFIIWQDQIDSHTWRQLNVIANQ